MSSHKQIDVTQDIMQQLPGEVVAHIASFTEKKDLGNFRLVSRDAAAKTSIEFAKQNLQHLRVNLRIALGDYENWHTRGITGWDHFITSDIEAVIKILNDNDRAGYAQEITFVQVAEHDIDPTIDTSRDPSAPDHGVGTTKAARLLDTLLSKLTSLRKVTLSRLGEPGMTLLLHVLKCQPQLRLANLAINRAQFWNESDLTSFLSLFSPSLRSLNLSQVKISGHGWRKLLHQIRDELKIEEFTEERSMIIDRAYLLQTTAFCDDFGSDVSKSEYYDLQAGSAVMEGKIVVKRGVDELWRLMRKGPWNA